MNKTFKHLFSKCLIAKTSCRNADNCNELTPVHSILVGADEQNRRHIKPSTLAVFRLMTDSYLMDSTPLR